MKKKVISERQYQANRINGALGGPKTEAGKNISKLNSLKHNLTGETLLLSIEDQPHFDAMLSEYLQEFNPTGIEERDLVDEIVAGRWRQKRLWGVETALFELALLDSEEATAKKFETAGETTRIAFALLRQHGHLRAVDLLSCYEGGLRRLRERARRDLEHIQASKMPIPVQLQPPARTQAHQIETPEEPPVTVRSMLSMPQPTWESVYTVEPKSEPVQPESDLVEEPKPPTAA